MNTILLSIDLWGSQIYSLCRLKRNPASLTQMSRLVVTPPEKQVNDQTLLS